MAEWTITTLEACTDILGDGLHGTPIYSENGEYAFVNGNNLVDGEILIKKDTKKVDESQYEKYKKSLSNRTILVSINGTLGNVGTYNSEKIILGKSACYFNVKNSVDKGFIYYVVSSPAFRQYLESNATGTTIKNISLKQMREYSFAMPSYDEQQRISSILKTIDRKIKGNKEINKNLEQQAQAIFLKMFPDIFSARTSSFQNLIEFSNGKNKFPYSIGNIPVYGGKACIHIPINQMQRIASLLTGIGAYSEVFPVSSVADLYQSVVTGSECIT
ncbi:MAG: restriction endonuclease subunit S [Eubacterium ramulus]